MILIVDTETTGLDPKKDACIEVGAARFDEGLGKLVDVESWLLRWPTNDAQHINGIPPELLEHGEEPHVTALDGVGLRCIVAHNAAFDMQWLRITGRAQHVPWVCSLKDIRWPRGAGKLETLALNHGVAVMPGHRAIYDVLTLVRVFEAMPQFGTTAKALIDAALQPKSEYRSLQRFGDNGLAQTAGFSWDPARKMWLGRFTDEEIAAIEKQDLFGVGKVRS